MTSGCIRRDREFLEEWACFLDSKWDGMQLAQHIGFTKWNEDDYRYPVIEKVEPAHKPRMSVSRKDEEKTAVKNYGALMILVVSDFQYVGCREVILEIANSGCGSLDFYITVDETCGDGMPEWLEVTPMQGRVGQLQEVSLHCIREKLPIGLQNRRLIISDGDTMVAVDIFAKAVRAYDLPEHSFLPQNGVVTIGAEHFCRKKDVIKGKYTLLQGYGKYAAGLKVFPCTVSFSETEDKPEVTYRFYLEDAGVVLERILIHKPTLTLPDSYLGPKESCMAGPGIA